MHFFRSIAKRKCWKWNIVEKDNMLWNSIFKVEILSTQKKEKRKKEKNNKAEPGWPSGLQWCVCCVWHGWSWVEATNLHQFLWTCLQVCGLKGLNCHANLYTVNRCCTRGKSEDHTSEKACKGSTLALKPRADITESPKQGYQWPHKRDLCRPKIFKNKKDQFNFQHHIFILKLLFRNLGKLIYTETFTSLPEIVVKCVLQLVNKFRCSLTLLFIATNKVLDFSKKILSKVIFCDRYKSDPRFFLCHVTYFLSCS